MPTYLAFISGGGTGGVRTTDGTTWNTFSCPLSAHTYSSRDLQTLLQVDGTAVQRSIDGGDNWSALAGSPAKVCVTALQLANGTIILVQEEDSGNPIGVYCSTNGGVSFSQVIVDSPNMVNDCPGVLWETSTGAVLCGLQNASGTGQLWRSTDSGATWASVFTCTNFQNAMLIGMKGSTILMLVRGPSNVVEVYRSTDGGATWALRFTSDAADGDVSADCRNGPAYIASDDAWIFFTSYNTGTWIQVRHRSVDDGITWSSTDPFGTGPGKHRGGIISTTNNVLVSVVDVAGLATYYSTDSGTSWTAVTGGTTFAPSAMIGALSGPIAMTPATPARLGLEIEIAPARIQLLRESYKPVIRIF